MKVGDIVKPAGEYSPGLVGVILEIEYDIQFRWREWAVVFWGTLNTITEEPLEMIETVNDNNIDLENDNGS